MQPAIVSARALSKISAYQADTGTPGTGIVAIQELQTNSEHFNEESQKLLVSYIENGEWDMAQEMSDEILFGLDAQVRVHKTVDNDEDGEFEKIDPNFCDVVFNISCQEIEATSILLVAKDICGSLWVIVEACGCD
tara:strand:- start:62 stop:469 length:408 start_codon:yes stop_codon:yes gene_type:complete